MHFQNQKPQSITSLSATDFSLPLLPTHREFHAALLLSFFVSIKKVNELKRRGENSRQWRAPPPPTSTVCEFPTKEVYWSALVLAHTTRLTTGTIITLPVTSHHHHHRYTGIYKATLSSSCAEERCNSMYQALYSNSANRHVLKYLLLPSENNNPGCPSLYRVVAGTWYDWY